MYVCAYKDHIIIIQPMTIYELSFCSLSIIPESESRQLRTWAQQATQSHSFLLYNSN